MADPTEERLLAAFADYPNLWVSAETLARSLRAPGDVYGQSGPTATLVGRRLSKLADAGKVEKDYRDGAGVYRLAEEESR